jgi:hypothetical protein
MVKVQVSQNHIGHVFRRNTQFFQVSSKGIFGLIEFIHIVKFSRKLISIFFCQAVPHPHDFFDLEV